MNTQAPAMHLEQLPNSFNFQFDIIQTVGEDVAGDYIFDLLS